MLQILLVRSSRPALTPSQSPRSQRREPSKPNRTTSAIKPGATRTTDPAGAPTLPDQRQAAGRDPAGRRAAGRRAAGRSWQAAGRQAVATQQRPMVEVGLRVASATGWSRPDRANEKRGSSRIGVTACIASGQGVANDGTRVATRGEGVRGQAAGGRRESRRNRGDPGAGLCPGVGGRGGSEGTAEREGAMAGGRERIREGIGTGGRTRL